MENIDRQIKNYNIKILELEKRKTIWVLKKQIKSRQLKIDELFVAINVDKKQKVVSETTKQKKECSECRNTSSMSFRCDNDYCCNN
jgi:hypothetical protein